MSPDRAIGCFPVWMYAQCNVQFWRCSSLEQSPSINFLCFLLLLLFLCRKGVFHYRVDTWCVPLKLWFLSAGTLVFCRAGEAELEPSPSRPAEDPNNPPQSDFIIFLLYVHRHDVNGSILREGMKSLFTQEILESAMKVIHPVFQSMWPLIIISLDGLNPKGIEVLDISYYFLLLFLIFLPSLKEEGGI